MRPPRTLLAALLAVALAGCAAVPTSGPVERHSPQPAATSTGVQVAPLPPAQDATPLLVVEGFLHAMSVYSDGYAVARQYLTDAAAQAWHPESGVQVYADGNPPDETDQGVVLNAPLVGQVDAAGVYQPASGTLRLDFGLQKNAAGQWRITRPPDGLLVSRYLFSTGFDAVGVQFFATSGDVLVPELRYFASGAASMTKAVAAVLSGPSGWLAPAVRKPVGAGVTVESVTVDSLGLAHVALGGAAASLTADQRQALLPEITETMFAFDQVRGVEVFAGAQRWLDHDGRGQFTEASFSQYDPDGSTSGRYLFLARDGKLQRQRDTTDWADFNDVASGLPKLESLAVNGRQEAWAAVTGDGTQLVTGGMDAQRAKTVRQATALLAPGYSRSGELWSPQGSGLAGLRVYRDGAETKLVLDGLPRGRVMAVALSPDGVRLAAVVMSGNFTQLGLARVVRTEDRTTVSGWRLVDLSSLGAAGSQLIGLGWNTATELAVLRTDGNTQTSVALISQDGASLTDVGPSDSTSLRAITAAPGRPAQVLSTGGVLYRFTGEFDWELIAPSVDAAAYSG